jgi:glutamate-1-semialdehyde 2,1-aminomutase
VELAKRTITAIADRLAAIIIRPEAWSPQAIGEFSGLCRQTGMILIFDEVTSHFKYGRHGAAGKLGIWPDLLCISKGLANGLPLSALLGSEALMRHANSARISTTYASECTALAALMVGEHLMSQSPSWPVWQREMGLVVQGIQRQIYALDISSELEIVQHPGFFSIQSKGKPFRDDPFRYYLVGHLADHGIFTRGWFHGSDNHTPADWQRLQWALSDSLSRWVQR